MKFKNFEKLNVRYYITEIIFQRKPDPDILKKAKFGLDVLEKAIKIAFKHDLEPEFIDIHRITKELKVSENLFGKEIIALQLLANKTYDGFFDPPKVVNVETLLFALIAIMLAEWGRTVEDLEEYTVYTNMDRFFCLEAIDSKEDLLVWLFLTDYLVECLKNKKKEPISKYLKLHSASKQISCHKINSFMKKNVWYRNDLIAESLFGEESGTLGLADIVECVYEYFLELKEEIRSRNF